MLRANCASPIVVRPTTQPRKQTYPDERRVERAPWWTLVNSLRSNLLGNAARRVRYFEHVRISACATQVAISNLVVVALGADGDAGRPIDRAARA